jgi:hypothetical protein
MAISIRILGLMLILVLVSACSSSFMRGSWASPDHIGEIENVYVVGFTQDELIRRIFEDSFGSSLTNRGVNTVSSYKDLPANEEFNREEIIKTMAEKGFDSVLFSKVVSQRSETVINPGYVSYGGRGYYGGRGGRGGYGGYYGGRGGFRSYDSAIYQPSTSTEFTIFTVESALYDLQTGEMIWSANLEVVDEINFEKGVQDYVEVVTKDLEDKGLILSCTQQC